MRLCRPLLCVVAILTMIGCDKGTDPKPVRHGPYAFYMNGVDREHPNYIYEYWPEADSLDTLIVDMTDAGSIAVSPDGKLLYLGTRTETAVVEIATESVLVRLPYFSYGGIAASPDGRFLALAGEGFWLLDASTYEVLYQDTGSFGYPAFDRDDDLLLVLQKSKGILAIHVDELTRPIEYFSFEPASVTRVLPLPRSNLWAVYLMGNTYAHYVVVYSPTTDSVLHTEFSSTGYGDLCVDLSGRWLYFSVPGTLISGPPERFVVEIDLWQQFYRTNIPTTDILDQRDSLVPLFLVDYLAMTPDNRYLGGTRRIPGGAFLAIDRKQEVFSACYSLNYEPNYTQIYRIAVQTNP